MCLLSSVSEIERYGVCAHARAYRADMCTSMQEHVQIGVQQKSEEVRGKESVCVVRNEKGW